MIRKNGEGPYLLVLGVLASKLLVVWQLEAIVLKSSKYLAFSMTSSTITHTVPKFLAIHNVEDFIVYPSGPAAPLQFYIDNGKKIPSTFGVVLIQHGDAEVVLLHAARNVLFSLGLDPLKTLAREWAIACPCVTFPAAVTALVSFYTGVARMCK